MGATARVVSGARVTGGDLRSMFVRSFFLQALWNFRRMQNLGWLFALWPVLRRVHRAPEDRSSAAVEHLEFFNTHPCMASLVLGVVAGMEEDRAAGGRVSREQIRATKKFMSAPLAALGDTLFWATARPFFASVAALVGALGSPAWAPPAVFLTLYNAVHVSVHAAGLAAGYRWRAEGVARLARWPVQRTLSAAALLGAAVCAAGLVALWISLGQGRMFAGALAAASLLLFRAGVSPSKIFYGGAAAGTLCAYSFGL